MQNKSRTSSSPSSIAKLLKSTIGEARADKIARMCGLIRRKREITPIFLLCACLSTLAVGKAKWLADILRTFNALTGKKVRYKPFHKQLAKPEFAEFARLMLNEALRKLTMPILKSLPQGKLTMFRDILMHDGTSFAVKDSLAKVFPGRFTKVSPAAIELHVTMSGFENNLNIVTLAPDKESERHFVPDPENVRGCLLLEDRGYESRKAFTAIKEAGGYFIIRGKTSIKPIILKARNAQGRRVKSLEGKPLNLKKLSRENFDLDIEWGKGSGVIQSRLILLYKRGKRNKKQFMLLHTNLTSSQFTITEIGQLYRFRWQIELLFKEWKSHANLHKFDTSKVPIAEGLIWMSLLAATLTRHLAGAAELTSGIELSTQRVASATRHFLDKILRSLLQGRGALVRALTQAFAFMKENTQRAHPKRDRKKGRLAIGLCPVAAA